MSFKAAKQLRSRANGNVSSRKRTRRLGEGESGRPGAYLLGHEGELPLQGVMLRSESPEFFFERNKSISQVCNGLCEFRFCVGCHLSSQRKVRRDAADVGTQ